MGGCQIRGGRGVTAWGNPESGGFPSGFLAENVNYGFRRNLWGLKPIGLPIAAGFALSFWALLLLTIWGRPWPNPWWEILVSPR